MAFLFTSSGAAIIKAGANVSDVWKNGAFGLSGQVILDRWSNDSEGRIMAETRKDFSGAYSTLAPILKNTLNDISSSMIAKQLIQHDMRGYPLGKAEAFTMINIQDDIIRTGIQFLKDFKAVDIKSI